MQIDLDRYGDEWEDFYDAIVARRRAAESPPVSEMKTGTIPKGSTTMNTARKIVTIWLARDIPGRL